MEPERTITKKCLRLPVAVMLAAMCFQVGYGLGFDRGESADAQRIERSVQRFQEFYSTSAERRGAEPHGVARQDADARTDNAAAEPRAAVDASENRAG